MTMRVLVFLVLLISPKESIGQTAPVRSGEHPGFSRLVIEFDNRPDWSLARDDQGYVLTTDLAGQRYGLDSVFQLIPRTRIADVSQQDGGLVIQLACSVCYADVFEFGRSALVIDIRDGVAPESSDFEHPLQSGAARSLLHDGPYLPNSAPLDAMAAGVVLPRPWDHETERTVGPAALSDPRDGRFAQLENRLGGWQQNLAPAGALNLDRYETSDVLAIPNTEEPATRGTADAIALQLSRAATQGLVDVAGQDVLRSEQSMAPNDEPGNHLGNDQFARVGPNLRVQTSIDRDTARTQRGGLPGNTAPQCPDPDRFDITQWGSEDKVGQEIWRFRAALADEFDMPDRSAVSALARHYLYLSLGAEVKMVFRSYSDLLQDEDEILAIAAIIENAPDARSHQLINLIECGPFPALWALLGVRDAREIVDLPTSNVLEAFDKLSLHLRRHLAPELARRLKIRGDSDSARQVIAMVRRAGGQHGAAIDLASAELSAGPRPYPGHRDILGADPPEAAKALILLIDEQMARGDPISQELMDTAGSFAFELRKHALGPELKRSQISALIANGDFSTALSEIEHARSDLLINRPIAHALRQAVLQRANTDTSDGKFLLVAAAISNKTPAPRSNRTVYQETAIRAYRLGFPELAQLYESKGRGDSTELRLSRAHSALIQQVPEKARQEIFGLPAKQVATLSAEIHSASRMHMQASTAFLALGDQSRAEQEALRAQSWRALRLVSPVGDLLAKPTPEPGQFSTSDPTLAPEMALKTAADSRDRARILLEKGRTPGR